MKYIIIVTRADKSRACYGPIDYNVAKWAKEQLEQVAKGSVVEIIALTPAPNKIGDI